VSSRAATYALALRKILGAGLQKTLGAARRAGLTRGLALCLAAAGGTLVPGSATCAAGETPSTRIRATFGAWQKRCQQPRGAKHEKCVLVQSVKAEDHPHLSLTVIFLHAFNGSTKVLRVVAPLGVLLPTGLGLKIDNADVGHVPFLKCVPNGCLAEVVVNDELIGKLKTGANAAFILFQTPDYGVGIPVPLQGFSQGADSLN
jgi:invasion protein IalB